MKDILLRRAGLPHRAVAAQLLKLHLMRVAALLVAASTLLGLLSLIAAQHWVWLGLVVFTIAGGIISSVSDRVAGGIISLAPDRVDGRERSRLSKVGAFLAGAVMGSLAAVFVTVAAGIVLVIVFIFGGSGAPGSSSTSA